MLPESDDIRGVGRGIEEHEILELFQIDLLRSRLIHSAKKYCCLRIHTFLIFLSEIFFARCRLGTSKKTRTKRSKRDPSPIKVK